MYFIISLVSTSVSMSIFVAYLAVTFSYLSITHASALGTTPITLSSGC